ncbi:MAG: energy-coupling factor transporter transmembrane component T [Spirochaetales bacterium]
MKLNTDFIQSHTTDDVAEKKGILHLDARVKYVALIVGNVLCFSLASVLYEIVFVSFMILLIGLQGKIKEAIIAGAVYVGMCILYFYISVFPQWLVTILIVVPQVKRMSPIFFAATMLLMTTGTRELIATLYKLGLPKAVNMALCVAIRYFPSFTEDMHHIKKAMRLRNIRGIKRITGFYMPILSSASRISDEITEAAITRGIENPCKKTCLYDYRLNGADYVFMALIVAILVCSFLSKALV